MPSQSWQRQFYKIAALSMIAAGSAILAFSAWGALKPREACQDTLVISTDVLAMQTDPCIDRMYKIGQSSNNFIPIVLSICLMAFGGAITGMIIRL